SSHWVCSRSSRPSISTSANRLQPPKAPPPRCISPSTTSAAASAPSSLVSPFCTLAGPGSSSSASRLCSSPSPPTLFSAANSSSFKCILNRHTRIHCNHLPCHTLILRQHHIHCRDILQICRLLQCRLLNDSLNLC